TNGVTALQNSVFTPPDLTISLWVSPKSLPTSGNIVGLVDKRDPVLGNSGYVLELYNNSGTQTVYWLVAQGAFVTNYTLPLNAWTHLALTQSGTAGTLYINGALNNTGSAPALVDYVKSLWIGRRSDGYYFDGKLDEVKIYGYARDSRQVALDYNGGGPVAYWSFEEGYASTTADRVGANHATLQDNTAWTLSGKVGKALSFDGTNDDIIIADSTSLRPSSLTVSAWIKPGASITDSDFILVKDRDTGSWDSYAFSLNSSRKISFGVQNKTLVQYPSWLSNASLSASTWYHVAATYEGRNFNASDAVIYVNGSPVSTTYTANGYTSSFTIEYNTQSAYIGSFSTNSATSYFNGLIDEVKLYNYARTPEEVRQDYNSGGGASGKSSNIVLGAVRNSASTWDDGGFGGAAPVTWWRFEEQSGQYVNDSGSATYTGTLGANSTAASDDPVWTVNGKAGGALYFAGTVSDHDIVTVASSTAWNFGTGDFTINVWYMPNSVDTAKAWGLLSTWPQSGGYSRPWALVWHYTNGIRFYHTGAYAEVGTSLTVGKWYFISIVRNSGTINSYLNTVLQDSDANANQLNGYTNLEMGRFYSGYDNYYGNFWLDEPKIYNYARTQAQLNWEYKQSRPGGG
ncbi:hypothetical protein COU01_03640, partial [Candidatus Falkowbacteria bacterium CG10_big_fil_rev_8_21_14_0_10_44_15]